MRRLIASIIVVALLGAGGWWYLRPQPVRVTVVTAEIGPVAATITNTRAGTRV